MKTTLVIFTISLLSVVMVSDSFAGSRGIANKGSSGIVSTSDQSGKYELGPKVVTNKGANS